MPLQDSLSSWGGKSSEDIQKIYQQYESSFSFIDDVVTMIASAVEEKAATWLLKHYVEKGNTLSAEHIHTIYHSLPKLTLWEAHLHLLQCMTYMPIQSKDKKVVDIFIRKNLSSENKFVRAWAYNGLYELASCFPDLQAEARSIFAMAMNDEAASVKARIRNIMKKEFS